MFTVIGSPWELCFPPRVALCVFLGVKGMASHEFGMPRIDGIQVSIWSNVATKGTSPYFRIFRVGEILQFGQVYDYI